MLFSWSVIYLSVLSFAVNCWSYKLFTNSYKSALHHRVIRETEKCLSLQTPCNSGECIPNDVWCDGEIDCPDGSDETDNSCKNTTCSKNMFQCRYGACVDENAKCNGRQECADNSDETLSECNVVVDSNCGKNETACNDGTCISKWLNCDGTPDCADGSDETHLRCHHITYCPRRFFQCRYGACVNGDAPCNEIKECADNSDEDETLCKDTVYNLDSNNTEWSCTLPARPENGYYYGQVSSYHYYSLTSTISLKFFCRAGYKLIGASHLYCNADNVWNHPFPKCLKTCDPLKSSTLEIKCHNSRNGSEVDCTRPVLLGTRAEVSCKEFYHYPLNGGSLPTNSKQLVCKNGFWDKQLPECVPVCGTRSAKGRPFIIGGGTTEIGEYPWHVGVYRKIRLGKREIKNNVCGGSIINKSTIITAAHCIERGAKYAVAAGKYYGKWDDARDQFAQKRNASSFKLPPKYKGPQHSFQNDIAIIIVDEPFEFSDLVKPVCVDWSGQIEKHFFKNGSIGYVAGWGLEKPNGYKPEILKHLEMKYIPYDICFNESKPEFRRIMGSGDKICAGRNDDQNVCEGDSGGGLTFAAGDLHYLIAVVSVGPDKDHSCNPSEYTSFTQFSSHTEWAKPICVNDPRFMNKL